MRAPRVHGVPVYGHEGVGDHEGFHIKDVDDPLLILALSCEAEEIPCLIVSPGAVTELERLRPKLALLPKPA